MNDERFFSKHKVEISIGFISSAVFAFLMWIINQLASTGPNIIRFIGNRPYYQAAHTQTHSFEIDALILFTGMVFGICLSTVFPALRFRKRIKKQEIALNNLSSLGSQPSKPESKKEAPQNTPQMQSLVETRFIANQLTKTSIFLIVDCTLLITALIYMFVFPLYLSDTFERHIIMITPYTTSSQIDMLKSDWVRMKTKADFEAIDEQVMRIVEEYGLQN